MIATVHGRGFRFVASLDPRSDVPCQELARPHARSADAALCSIAVLPCASLSDDKDTSRFASGLVEEILDHLARAEHYRLYSRRWTLKVASRTASARFAGAGEDIPAVARELGVGYVLEGSVRRVGDSIRVTAQLIRGEDGFHVWSKSYDQPLAGELALQTRLARNIAHLATAELFFDLSEPWAMAGNAGFAGVAPAAVKQFVVPSATPGTAPLRSFAGRDPEPDAANGLQQRVAQCSARAAPRAAPDPQPIDFAGLAIRARGLLFGLA